MTLTPRLLAAWTAPSTSDLGALSPPIASTAMVTIWGSVLLLSDFDYFTALVLPTVRAHAVGEFGLMAVGTFRKAGSLQSIMRAARARPLVGVSTFGIRHISSVPLDSYCNSSLRSAPQRSSPWFSTRQSHVVSF